MNPALILSAANAAEGRDMNRATISSRGNFFISRAPFEKELMKRSGRYGLRLLHRGTVELIKNGCNDSEPKAVMDGAKLFPEWEPQDLAEQLRATEKNQLPANRESS